MHRLIDPLYHNLMNNPVKRNVLAAVAGAWFVLNVLLFTIPDTLSLVLLLLVNVWFGCSASFTYRCGKLWLDKHFAGLIKTERWAKDYLKQSPEKQKIEQFELGDWIVTDAIMAMDEVMQQAVVQSFQVDKFVRSQAFLDSETGIGNRVYFDHRIEAFLADTESNSGGCVYLIQLRELDVIQVDAGKIEALELLNYFIALINKYLEDHPNAVFARRSEFDFAVLIPHISIVEAEKVASRLIRLCNRIPLPECVDREHFFHIGVAVFQPSETVYQVLAEADMALRAAQLQGPSNWFMYDKGIIVKDLAKGSVKWRTSLDLAINQQAFVLLFQPVMLTDNSVIHHHEILARMRNDNGQLASAAVFLPMAQKFGMVARVDQLMVEKTIKLLQYEKSSHDICSLNLHVDSLLDTEFQRWLLDYLQRYPKAACRIIIEISEYHLVHKGAALRYFFRAVHKVGARLLVDHVGLYVLNTQYIREFEIDYLKLHVSVVKNIDSRPENQLFVKSLQGACSGTHVLIFGLGVERVGEWIALQKLGVAGAQGHYFTEPLESINQITPSH
ncbi:MAG: EAL domain-containing protein [Algicola sp.]|nr:EAL domain-containing protein [Algicola sp.]